MTELFWNLLLQYSLVYVKTTKPTPLVAWEPATVQLVHKMLSLWRWPEVAWIVGHHPNKEGTSNPPYVHPAPPMSNAI